MTAAEYTARINSALPLDEKDLYDLRHSLQVFQIEGEATAEFWWVYFAINNCPDFLEKCPAAQFVKDFNEDDPNANEDAEQVFQEWFNTEEAINDLVLHISSADPTAVREGIAYIGTDSEEWYEIAKGYHGGFEGSYLESR